MTCNEATRLESASAPKAVSKTLPRQDIHDIYVSLWPSCAQFAKYISFGTDSARSGAHETTYLPLRFCPRLRNRLWR
jgi:hypothetical protein